MVEARASKRCWKATLTFSPQEAFLYETEARQRARKRNNSWDMVGPRDRKRYLLAAAGRRLTLAFKRARVNGFKVRYISVPELHKSGVVHFHLVIHEIGDEIRKQCQHCRGECGCIACYGTSKRQCDGRKRPCCWQAFWPHGFSQFKLVAEGGEAAAIRYATKYAAKDNCGRIRSSIRYGVDGGQCASVSQDQHVRAWRAHRAQAERAAIFEHASPDEKNGGGSDPKSRNLPSFSAEASPLPVPAKPLWRWDNAERAALDRTWEGGVFAVLTNGPELVKASQAFEGSVEGVPDG